MAPKKKKIGTKKKIAKPPLVIAADDKLPALSNSRTTALISTVASSDIKSLVRLVAHYDFGKVLDTSDVNGSTPIHIAVKRNDIPTIERLLSYKAIDINKTELPIVGGYTALHHACLNERVSIIQLLLQSGANPNIKCNSAVGETALQLCCKLGNIDCARKLMQAGASGEIRDNFGNNSSFWAYKYHQDALIRELGLHAPKSATAEEFLALMIRRNPAFVLPAIKVKKTKKTTGKKKK
jgi:ankyrin repeat protein